MSRLLRALLDLSLRGKLTLLIVLAAGVALVPAGATLFVYELVMSRHSMARDTATLAEVVGANCTAALAFNDPKAAEETLAALGAEPHVVSASIFTKDGALFAHHARADAAAAAARPPDRPGPDGSRFAGDHLVLFQPVVLRGERIGTIHILADIEAVRARLRLFALVIAVVVALSCLVALSLSSKLQRPISRPILELADTARSVSERKDYSVRAAARGRDEVGVLIESFNQMLAQVQDRDLALRKAYEELREKTEVLRQSEERFRLLVEGVKDYAIFMLDAEGRVASWNAGAERILGHAAEAVIGRPHACFYAAEDAARGDPERALAAAVAQGWLEEDGWRVRRDGSRFFASTGLTALRAEAAAGLRGFSCVMQDLTQRRELEAQLRQAQKMEAIGRLAGGVAHDFNNILMAIGGYSALLGRRLDADDPRRKLVEETQKAASRAAALTRQLLAFSRRQLLQPKALDLRAAVADMEGLLRRLLGEDIALAIAAGGGPGRVRADPSQLEQVIMNLAVNARDAMPNGGKLTIEIADVEIDASSPLLEEGMRPGPYAMLAVSDTGHGMDDETRAHLFEPFFTTKDVGKGTGLGLSTVYGIVRQSGGTIGVESEPGRGTTFRVYLPAGQAPEAPQKAAAPGPAPAGGSETILLAEDEDAVRSVVRAFLVEHGYRVLEGSDGGAALRVAAGHAAAIDLLVTDVVMPDMGGPELAKRLAPLHPETRVLYVSGYPDDAVVRRGLLAGSVELLGKPFSPDELARKIREVLDGVRKE